jgi:16S rRNA (cytidine1402-2'-O)-methyltransferase
MVIVVASPDRQVEVTAVDLDSLLRQALGRVSVKDAVAEVAAVTGTPRRDVYQRALALDKERGHGR